MTVANNPNKFTIAGDGVTTAFPFSNLRLIDQEDLEVYLEVIATGVLTLQTKGVDYSLSYDEDDISGTITFLITPPPATDNVFGVRNTPLEQPFDVPSNSDFDAEKIENMSDNAVAIIQDQQDELNRSLKYSPTSTVTGADVPDPLEGRAIVGNATNDGWELSTNKVDEVVDNAQSSATSAASSATAAANSASSASTSATSAASSATAAAASAASINLPSITSTDTGKLLVVNGAGDAYELGESGTSGQVLTSNGADSTPTYQDAGVVDASTTVKGVVEVSTDAEVTSETETGSTGAILAVTPENMKHHQGVAKAWVKCSGVTGAISDSYNVSSVTDTGTGIKQVNFTNSMANANYCVSATCGYFDAAPPPVQSINAGNAATGSFRLYTGNTGGNLDVDFVYAAVFGDV